MAAVLFVAVGVDVTAGGPSVAAATSVTAERVIGAPVHAHGGSLLRAEASDAVAQFGSSLDAVSCALAIRSEVAERNRTRTNDSPPVRAQCFVHAEADEAATGVSEATLQHAALAGRLTPAGRVFISKSVFLDVRGVNLFALVPLGQERFAGLLEPVDVFEAISATQRGWVLPAERRPASTPRMPPPTLSHATDRAARDSSSATMPHRSAVPTTWTGWASTLLLAALGFAVQRLVLTLLKPLLMMTYLTGVAGVFVFGVTGSESRALVGGVLLPVAVPCAVTVFALVERRPVLARWSIFWTGLALAGVGGSVLTHTDHASLASVLRMGLVELLGMFGAGASAGWIARGSVLVGYVLMAAPAFATLRVETHDDAASTRIAA